MIKQKMIKLEKVDDKTAYQNLLVKYAELENKIADIKANCDFALEGKDVEIKELKDHLAEEVELHLHAEEYIKSLEKENTELKKKCYKKAVKDYCELEKDNAELKKQIEKMKCCANCEKYFVDCKMEDVTEEEYLRANAFCKHWKLKEIEK